LFRLQLLLQLQLLLLVVAVAVAVAVGVGLAVLVESRLLCQKALVTMGLCKALVAMGTFGS